MISAPSTPQELQRRKDELATQPTLHPHADLHTWTTTLVFAPHPDDESLGCGGLIALLRERGQAVHVVFVSDGAMSHPNSRRYDRARRVSLREQEATEACAELGVAPQNITFLRYRDTEVPRRNSPGFDAAVEQVNRLITEIGPSHVLVPWRRDPHCDHRGTWEICRAARELQDNPPHWVEYPIWMWNSDRVEELPLPGEVVSWRLDVSEQLDRKWRAVDRHVSQLTRMIDDDPEGFMLEEAMLANFRRPTELYFEDADKQHRTLSESYFNEVYAASDDPWSFETNQYELDKYSHTIESLPAEQYGRALEIGCSIGVLTRQLAPFCEELIAVDTAAAPLVTARERLRGYPQVSFEQMEIPSQFPAGNFDLIVISEVGYYWSKEDLDRAVGIVRDRLNPGGDLVLVHYTPYVPDYPLTGDEVHAVFAAALERRFTHVRSDRAERYRLDVYQRPASA